MAEIKRTTQQNNQIDKCIMRNGQILTPKQVAKKIDGGAHVTHKGQEVHSVEGKHVQTNPDKSKKNNLVPKK